MEDIWCADFEQGCKPMLFSWDEPSSSATISADLRARLTKCQKACDLSEEDTNLILGEEASISGNEYPLVCGDTLIVSFRYS